MQNLTNRTMKCFAAAAVLLIAAAPASAKIDGITGPNFTLTAKADHISTADGGSLLLWGLANGSGRAQYPAPTLIVNQGDIVTVTLTNSLDVPVSLLFPGQENVTSSTPGGQAANLSQQGLLALEANKNGTVIYSFVASQPGTFMYHSGTRPELQIEMGLLGALIVRPQMGAKYAYNHAGTQFDREYLFLLTEMDPRIHQRVEFQGVAALDSTDYLGEYVPNYFFINGRTAFDTMNAAGVLWLPTQPYNIFPQMKPGEKMLLRTIGGGREFHPFHTHGNHAKVIARDARLMESAPGQNLDLAHELFVINATPGETVDATFEWTGKDLGWDIYGLHVPHTCNGIAVDAANPASAGFDPVTKEYCPDHGKPFPVVLPETQFLAIGPFYGGSPFMGALGALPPGEGGLNPAGGFAFMWHSHNERELTNYNIFPGGMLTMMVVQPPSAVIVE